MWMEPLGAVSLPQERGLDPTELPARGCGHTPGFCHLYSCLTEGL